MVFLFSIAAFIVIAILIILDAHMSFKKGAYNDGMNNSTSNKWRINNKKTLDKYMKYFFLGREHRKKIKEFSELYNKDE